MNPTNHTNLVKYVNNFVNSCSQFDHMFLYQNQGDFVQKNDDQSADSVIPDLPTSEQLYEGLLSLNFDQLNLNCQKALSNIIDKSGSNRRTSKIALVTLNNENCNLENNDVLENEVLNAHSFENWLLARNLCSDNKIQWNSKVLYNLNVKKIHVSPQRTDLKDYDRELLAHLFNTIVQNCSPQEKQTIIHLKNKMIKKFKIAKNQKMDLNNKIWMIAEKIVSLSEKVFKSSFFQFAVGFAVCCTAGVTAYKAIYFLKEAAIFHGLPKLINYSPLALIKAVNIIHDNIVAIWILTSLASLVNRSQKLEKWVFAPVKNLSGVILNFPSAVISLAIKAGMSAASYAKSGSIVLGNKLEALNKKWTDLRLGKELVDSRELWIDSLLNERNEYRQQFSLVPAGLS